MTTPLGGYKHIADEQGNTIQIPDGPANLSYTVSSGITTEATELRKAQGQAVSSQDKMAETIGRLDDDDPESGPDTAGYAAQQARRIIDTSLVLNGNVIPNIRVLLAEVIGALDASIPNKDQNKAVKHIIRGAFDRAYFDIISRAYPDSNFGRSGGDYAVTPAVNRLEAFSTSTSLKQ